MSASDRRRRRRVEPTDEWEGEKPLQGSEEAFFLTQAMSTVGAEPAGTNRYSLDKNPLTYANLPHT
jgi:hypothetical protein